MGTLKKQSVGRASEEAEWRVRFLKKQNEGRASEEADGDLWRNRDHILSLTKRIFFFSKKRLSVHTLERVIGGKENRKLTTTNTSPDESPPAIYKPPSWWDTELAW